MAPFTTPLLLPAASHSETAVSHGWCAAVPAAECSRCSNGAVRKAGITSCGALSSRARASWDSAAPASGCSRPCGKSMGKRLLPGRPGRASSALHFAPEWRRWRPATHITPPSTAPWLRANLRLLRHTRARPGARSSTTTAMMMATRWPARSLAGPSRLAPTLLCEPFVVRVGAEGAFLQASFPCAPPHHAAAWRRTAPRARGKGELVCGRCDASLAWPKE